MKIDFASALAAGRKRHGWTLQEVATSLDVSLYTVRSWLKPASVSRREAPDWAGHALAALAYGRPVSVVRGAVRVTYEPATKTP